MKLKAIKIGAVAAMCGMVVGACTPAEQRVATGGLLGAGAGALIGGAIGGNRGAVAGALLGGLAGLAIADSIERERAQEAALYAARTGGSGRRAFRNSKGQSVVMRTRTVRTYKKPSGERVRVVKLETTRDGQSGGSEEFEAREVKLASGKTDFVIE